MQQFSEINLPPQLSKSLQEMGFVTPTPIQCEAIPVALDGKDILGSAQTGTGKTGAFGIPLVASLINNPESCALILLPTRELAVQVMDSLKLMLNGSQIKTALLIGGQSMLKQFNQLRSKPRLVVGTPGRVNDHLKRATLKLDKTTFLVLDETDRMLDMGFGIQLDQIAKFLTSKRQTLMFSATMPSNIQKLAAKYLTDPVRISVGETSVAAVNIKQEHAYVSEVEKFPRLLDELNARKGSIIIFAKTKHGAAKLAEKLKTYGHETDAIHGNLRQNRRDSVISNFRKEKYRILVATDVACRGLDIPHIEHVINYDIPQASEDYIHRIGRTARAGAEGNALSLLTPADNAKWRAIQFLLDPTKKTESIPGAKENSGKGKKRDRNRRGSDRFNRWKDKKASRPTRHSEQNAEAVTERNEGNREERRPRQDSERRRSFGGGDRRKSFGGERRSERGGERRDNFKQDRRERQRDERPKQDGENRRPLLGTKGFVERREQPRSFGDKSEGQGERRKSFGGGERKSFNNDRLRQDGDRPRKSFGNKRPNFSGERRSEGGEERRNRFGGGERRKSFNNDRPRQDGERPARPFDGKRREGFGSGERRKSFGGGKKFGGNFNGGRRKAAA